MTDVITTTNLEKQYSNTLAVDNLNLAVEEGSVFGFLGPNGSGKSTTIGMLMGLIQPTRGEATVAGINPESDPVSVRSQTGVLPEGFTPYPTLTGRDHLKHVAELRGATVDADDALARVGLTEAKDRQASGYSKGMTQRLGLATALIGNPAVLILDEPFAGLDPDGSQIVREVVEQERERGTTILFSSHILGEVQVLCDHIGILSEGQLLTRGEPGDLQREAGLRSKIHVSIDGGQQKVAEAASNISFAEVVSTSDGEATLTYDSDNSHLDVVRALEANGGEVTDAVVDEPTVEDIYRAFT
ncbi:ABC-type transport system ATP-binding protein (plasmid) [Halobacterium hubeiense]|uniref:ABC-type transport system ATP-binding protein n=1 Tax=Halobacterium hubeiense TaxID=1407499 RepID=A0A0U5H719_9EURY|nr:ABC transporter ATP-binding protein [Halobacterium hubeiense]CQH63909.1 ABC-type transport system ATP-binding protein [Halobacterium hubeiense]